MEDIRMFSVSEKESYQIPGMKIRISRKSVLYTKNLDQHYTAVVVTKNNKPTKMTMKTMRFETHKAASTTNNSADVKPPRSPTAVQVCYKRDGLVLTRSSSNYASTTVICKSPPASPPRMMTRPGSPVQTKEYADEDFFCYDSDDEEDLEQEELFGLAFVQEE